MEYVTRMNWSKKQLVFGLGGLLLATAARGDVNPPGDNSYHVVVERNPFGLNPPKAVLPPTNAPPPVKVDVKFSGIYSKGTRKEAFLVIPPTPGKLDKSPQYLTMRENETQGDIQVLEIDDKENTVKIVNAGTPVVLTFKENGFTTPTAAAMPGNPLMPRGVPGGVLPTPGIVPALTTPAPGIRTAGVTPTGMPVNEALAARYGLQNTAPGNTTTVTPVRTIPIRNVRTPALAPQAQAQEAPVDPVVQRIIMEAQAENAKRRGENFPPLPPLPGGTGK